MTAERCFLSKSGKKENVDDDDDALRGESDWSEKDFADREKGTRDDDAKGNDERTEVGKTMETSVIGKLGNKPPSNAYKIIIIRQHFQVKSPSFKQYERNMYLPRLHITVSVSLSFRFRSTPPSLALAHRNLSPNSRNYLYSHYMLAFS